LERGVDGPLDVLGIQEDGNEIYLDLLDNGQQTTDKERGINIREMRGKIMSKIWPSGAIYAGNSRGNDNSAVWVTVNRDASWGVEANLDRSILSAGRRFGDLGSYKTVNLINLSKMIHTLYQLSKRAFAPGNSLLW